MFYERCVRPFVFRWSARDPEVAHEAVLAVLRSVRQGSVRAGLLRRIAAVRDRRLEQKVCGLWFHNPVGLAAGFDKNAVALQGLEALGFGFLEVGTVTAQAQPGNPRPRIFRLPADEALINRMGFNNAGAEMLRRRLELEGRPPVPLGISLGKSKAVPLEAAVDDYLFSFQHLSRHADYVVINVSSPNTPGLRALQERIHLDALLARLVQENTNLPSHGPGENKQRVPRRKPILVKIAPDLTWEALDELLGVVADRGVDGLIATNTTVGRAGLRTRTEEAGGLSGQPLFQRALEVVRFIRRRGYRQPVIGVGGIRGPAEALAMLQAGATLVQVYTGLIYQGPFLVRSINRGILRFLEREGISKLSDLPLERTVKYAGDS